MSSYVFLSHILSEATPGYGGSQGFHSKSASRISEGQSSNSMRWELSNHIGTHIDAPRHFSDAGATLDVLPADFWTFSNPCLIDMPVAAETIIDVGEWCESIPSDADFLIIKTQFEKHRQTSLYWEKNPGLSPELGRWLRKYRPSLRALGFDFISITSYAHRPLGKVAHQAFLDPTFAGNPLLVVEDMALAELFACPLRVTVLPLRVLGADGSPVTVLAELETKKEVLRED